MSSLAVALTSCGSTPDTRCLDTSTYKVVADRLCNSEPDNGYSDADRYQWYQQGGNSTHVTGYHRYYGSSGSGFGGGSGTSRSRSKGGSSGDGSSGDEGSTGKGVSRGGHSGRSHGGGSHGGGSHGG
ncbi:hypothetical protein [Streptacidiphilus sp. PB12-B1b]|uniref:hypothetical protein n=1 Tax=Streptacidiphilus sp. PB12-B1b TaxID=2705012 RepID=UPI001CDC969E|nr:hypothetical protein [Streptacidiphilus sp. PB12-B1b]